MAKEIQNGQAEYGIIHLQEEEMREAGVGVFEDKSTERRQRRERKRKPRPENKMEGGAPTNKSRRAKKAK